MERTDTGYLGRVPAEYVVGEWDLMIYVGAVEPEGGGAWIYPGLYHPRHPLPYLVVEVVRGTSA
jgi:hypothetical protein